MGADRDGLALEAKALAGSNERQMSVCTLSARQL